MEFFDNAVGKIKAWIQGIQRSHAASAPAALHVELGQLLPTFSRGYFTSIEELPLAAQREMSLAAAWWCAETSMLAYQNPGVVETMARSAIASGWQVKVFGAGEPTFAVLLKSRDAAILAFRGTRVSGFERLDIVFTRPWVDYEDLKTDAGVALAPHPAEGKVHGGILSSFQRFWERHGTDVIHAVGDLPLYITGHSLGGALATLAAASGELSSVVGLYSFGSPRVGDATFRTLIAAQELSVHRFVHGNDLITTLAPEGWFGYTHVGSARHIKRDGSAIDEVETNLASVLVDGLPLMLENVRHAILNLRDLRMLTPTRLIVPQDALADHAPLFYVERIRDLARRGKAQ